jgi:hypothetical protein
MLDGNGVWRITPPGPIPPIPPLHTHTWCAATLRSRTCFVELDPPELSTPTTLTSGLLCPGHSKFTEASMLMQTKRRPGSQRGSVGV